MINFLTSKWEVLESFLKDKNNPLSINHFSSSTSICKKDVQFFFKKDIQLTDSSVVTAFKELQNKSSTMILIYRNGILNINIKKYLSQGRLSGSANGFL